MVDRFEAPPPWNVVSREQLVKFKLDAAAIDAIMSAQDKVKGTYAKANEAINEVLELMQKAGIPPEARQGLEESSSAEGSEEEKEKRGLGGNGAAAGNPLLPPLPYGSEMTVKSVAKQNLAKITELLQNANVSADAPENIVTLWDDISRLIEGAGLSEAETKAAVRGVTGPIAVVLCIGRSLDLEKWRHTLSERYLNPSKAGGLLRRLYAVRRNENEAAVAYLTRVAPLVRAVMLMQLVPVATALSAVWDAEALGKGYCQQNANLFEQVLSAIDAGQIVDVDNLAQHVQARTKLETVPKTANPVALKKPKSKSQRCAHCRGNHPSDKCWIKFPEKRPGWMRDGNDNNANEANASECFAMPVGRDVFVVEAAVNGVRTQLGLDSMAALNLIRRDALPGGITISAGGPTLHGVGQAEASGTVTVAVTLESLTFAEVVFAVVDSLPVPGLLGKPTLTEMGARMDLAMDTAEIRAGERRAKVRAIALPADVLSSRPQAQSYWNWLNKRMAAAPKRLQVLFQDVMERADNGMLEKFLAGFPDWALHVRQMSGMDNAAIHPAPYRVELKRPEVVTTGLVVCPTVVAAHDIMAGVGNRDDLVAKADDNRDFLPPVMTFEEEDKKVDKEMARIVEEAELSEAGKMRLSQVLKKYRPAFGMQLRKVNLDQEPVHTYTTGELPEHQARRIIRDPRVRNAQIEWEDAMEKRGVIGELTCADPEKARPINIHHVIRDGKIRFTADARTRNAVTISDSFPVPSPMEALERFRRNRMFSTFDEADSFFQYPYDKESRVPFYSARGGVKEFRVMIQGGMNSPGALHRAKDKQYKEFAPEELAFMFDDSLLGTASDLEDVHLDLIERFLANCVAHGTILKATKAKLCRSEVMHQGFIIGHGYYYKDPEAVRPLVDMRLPTTASELKSQMSMLGRYRNFIPEYAQLAALLEAIMHERWQAGTFTASHAERLIEMRRMIAQETMLTMPDWNRPFHWRIDAQPTYGWAGVVGQEDEDGKFWPIRFMSKKASEADTKRWPTEMETMAWFYCLCDKGRVYSQYSKNIIHGDPKSLRWLADSIETGRANRQMQRVALALQALDIEFKYHPREEMMDVDALSRFAVDRRSSRDHLKKFLATDKDVVENTLIVAVTVPTREKLPTRLVCEDYSIAVPAGVGPDSPPGVPIDIRAEQEVDPICRFIMMIKRGEFRNEAEQNAFIATMPSKAAKALKHHVEVAKSREFAEFDIRRGKLFLVDENRLKMPRLRLVVPMRLRARVLTANHDAAAAGHRGFDKTYEAMMRLYFWFGMYADTKAWVKSCPGCAKGKRRTIAGHGTAQHHGLMPMKFPPFERVVFDLIGPLPESRDGMKYILISVDAHSSETKLDALKTRNSEDIANIMLKRVVLAEGCPKSWQSDNAPELIKGAMAKLADIAGIDPKSCTAYEAHVEGRVERRNWLVEMMLREMCKERPAGLAGNAAVGGIRYQQLAVFGDGNDAVLSQDGI
jgi:hypothetical protein